MRQHRAVVHADHPVNHRLGMHHHLDVVVRRGEEVVRFDDIEDAQRLAKPVLVKLDIQGYEPEFVAGASKLLAAADAMLLEYSPFGEKGREWISDYDKALTQNFTHVVRFDEMGARALPPEASYVELTQGVLDEIKQSIAGRDWADPKDGHENILLLRR